MRTAVFAAHEDDETGMSGTIVNHVRRGDQVKVVYLTDGGIGSLEIPPEELVEVREQEAKAACKALGVEDVEFLRFKDAFLFLNQATFMAVGKIIRSFRPHRIYTSHAEGSISGENLDHVNCFRIVNRAAFMSAWRQLPEMGKEPWRVQEICAYEIYSPLREPNAYVDVTDVMHIKLESARKHSTQVKLGGSWEDRLETYCRFRGVESMIGKYVEAFKIIRFSIM